MTGSGKYDRRPRRDWDDQPERRSATQQIGMFRLVGFFVLLIVVFAYTFQNFGKDDPKPTSTTAVTTPASGPPRMAVADALADVVRARLPQAKVRAGSSSSLLTQLQVGSAPNADVAFLAAADTQTLAGSKRCTTPEPIATSGKVAYAACTLTTNGASAQLAALAIDALTDLDGRERLLTAGFDVPEVRPTSIEP